MVPIHNSKEKFTYIVWPGFIISIIRCPCYTCLLTLHIIKQEYNWPIYLINKDTKHSFLLVFYGTMCSSKLHDSSGNWRTSFLIFICEFATILRQLSNYKKGFIIYFLSSRTQQEIAVKKAEPHLPISNCFFIVETELSTPRTISLWKCCKSRNGRLDYRSKLFYSVGRITNRHVYINTQWTTWQTLVSLVELYKFWSFW